jgi:hypothetical protein
MAAALEWTSTITLLLRFRAALAQRQLRLQRPERHPLRLGAHQSLLALLLNALSH